MITSDPVIPKEWFSQKPVPMILLIVYFINKTLVSIFQLNKNIIYQLEGNIFI